MSGHSKWSTIKHRKGAQDAKRGRLFSKLVREITTAAKAGGVDQNSNHRLKAAILKAKNLSMPSKNIDNAIKKGGGAGKNEINYQEVVYEGYGPSGVAILVECLTDNKNRTVSQVRATFSKNGGNLGESGSVAWQFEKKGLIQIEKQNASEKELMELALESEVDDVKTEEQGYTIVTSVPNFYPTHDLFKEKYPIANAEIAMVAKNTVGVAQDVYDRVGRLTDLLDELEDVQSVSSNEKLEQ